MNRPAPQTSEAPAGRTPGRPVRPCVRLVMPSIPRYLAVMRAAVGCMAGQEGFDAETTDRLVLAADEALSNVIKHGYDGAPGGEIQMVLRPLSARGKAGLTILILDRGRSIDPGAIQGRDLEDVRPGGLGVHIIRSVMDKARYRQRRGGGMMLRMVKHVAADAGTTADHDLAAGTR